MYFGIQQNFIQPKFFPILKRFKSILVIADHNNCDLTSATQSILTAAKAINYEITLLVAGTQCASVTRSIANTKDFKRILVAENNALDGFPEENLAELIFSLQKEHSFSHIIAGTNSFGKTVIPRVAAKLNIPAITDVIKIESSDVFVRPIYAGSALLTLRVTEPVKAITIRETHFKPCVLQDNKNVTTKIEGIYKQINFKRMLLQNQKNDSKQYQRLQEIEESIYNWKINKECGTPITIPASTYNLGLKSIKKSKLKRQNNIPLQDARIVICGGRGFKTVKNFNLVYDLAKHLKAAVGATGEAVKLGLAPKEIEIGQNGIIIAPDLYIAIGVSGSNQHIAGIKDSKTIIAIDKNHKAPIFRVANYCMVGNLFKIVPKLIKKLQNKQKFSLFNFMKF